MKRHATTIVLLVAVAVLGFWLWHDRDRVSATEKKSREGNVFAAWRREDLTKIEIAHEGETIVLVRDAKTDSAWRMTSPREERVDQSAVERLSTTLEFATVVRKVGDGDTLGFDRPRATGRVAMGGLAFTFALGGTSPRPEGSSYFKVDDKAAFVVSKELTDALLASSDSYRDRSVVPYLSLELARFEVAHPGGGFVVVRHDDRSFDVPSAGVLADRHKLDKAWAALAEMRAEAFPKDADADRLTAHPTLTIRMKPKDGSKGDAELVAGEACPGLPDDVVVLRKSPTRGAACAPKGAIAALLAITGDMLIDARPFSFRHDEMEEVRWEGGDVKPIEVARKGNGFHEREPVDRELPQPEADGVNELLTAIERSEASAVVAGKGAPFTAIAKTRVRAGEHEETVEVGAFAPGSDVTVRRVRDDARLTFPPAAARRLVPRETTLRSLLILPSETRRVTRVGLRCGVEQDFEDSGEGLKMTKPAGYETDGTIVQLVDGLTRGKVLGWTADRDDGTFGITPDGCRAVLGFADGNTPVTLRFGGMANEDLADGRADGRDGAAEGIYGSVDGERGVFVVPLAIESLVRRIYVNRAALRVEDAARVTLIPRGRPPVNGDPAAAARLFAERVVSLDPKDVGPSDLEIVITSAEGGAPRKVTCSASDGAFRRCVTPAVRATFEVPEAAIVKLGGAAWNDAGAQISDAGAIDAR